MMMMMMMMIVAVRDQWIPGGSNGSWIDLQWASVYCWWCRILYWTDVGDDSMPGVYSLSL